MSQLPEGGAAGAPQYYQWIFQWSFAATACTIVSGAIAERTRFEAYFFYSFFMAAWVYPIVVHSVWSVNGWANMNRANGPLLFQRGVIDFAGSGAVHMVGGEETVPGTLFSEPFWGGSLFFFHRKGKNSPLFLPLFFKKKQKQKQKRLRRRRGRPHRRPAHRPLPARRHGRVDAGTQLEPVHPRSDDPLVWMVSIPFFPLRIFPRFFSSSPLSVNPSLPPSSHSRHLPFLFFPSLFSSSFPPLLLRTSLEEIDKQKKTGTASTRGRSRRSRARPTTSPSPMRP